MRVCYNFFAGGYIFSFLAPLRKQEVPESLAWCLSPWLCVVCGNQAPVTELLAVRIDLTPRQRFSPEMHVTYTETSRGKGESLHDQNEFSESTSYMKKSPLYILPPCVSSRPINTFTGITTGQAWRSCVRRAILLGKLWAAQF